jgi:hypothetical protein
VKRVISKDEAALNSVAESFLSASGGVFRKCIGALDGIAFMIKCPVASNLISNPGNYVCRKGFYNFWLSNSRIQIECAFGKIVARWEFYVGSCFLAFKMSQGRNCISAPS